MSSLTSSIVRGFGFTIGKSAANSLLSGSSSNKGGIKKSNDLHCWSHEGFEEGDVDITYSRDFKKDEVSWFLFPFALVISAIPFLGLLMNGIFMYRVFIKKHYMYFWEFKWNEHTISDRRTKEGTRDIKVLEKDVVRIERHYPSLKNKIQIISCFIVSFITIYIVNL